jgi:hypothetical protein
MAGQAAVSALRAFIAQNGSTTPEDGGNLAVGVPGKPDFCRKTSSHHGQLTLAEARRTQSMNENDIGKVVIDAAVLLHRELGPRIA